MRVQEWKESCETSLTRSSAFDPLWRTTAARTGGGLYLASSTNLSVPYPCKDVFTVTFQRVKYGLQHSNGHDSIQLQATITLHHRTRTPKLNTP